MQLNISDSWKNILRAEFDKDYFKELMDFVDSEYKQHTCYPKEQDIFAAFNYCDFEAVKVVIIGQDPYHGKGQANGLCFSVQDEMKHPPSLVNIFKELKSDIHKPIPISGNLSAWAKQGVLLLNASLTVRESEAGSHQKQGWEQFTDAVIATISEQKKDIVFLLWGGFAKKKGKKIDKSKHVVLETGHPSPLSANRGYWFGNKHFSQTNACLEKMNRLPVIEW
jgi:uracil-DNA glycosylase